MAKLIRHEYFKEKEEGYRKSASQHKAKADIYEKKSVQHKTNAKEYSLNAKKHKENADGHHKNAKEIRKLINYELSQLEKIKTARIINSKKISEIESILKSRNIQIPSNGIDK